jgi:hypothetical protein
MTARTIFQVTGSALLALTLFGCTGEDDAKSGDGDGGGSSSSAKEGAESPEACFDAMNKAIEDKDFKAMYALVDPSERDDMVKGMYMGGYAACANWAEMGEHADRRTEYEALLEEHGAAKVEGELLKAFETLDDESAAKVEGVKDKPAFFAAVVAFMEKHRDPEEDAMMDTEEREGDPEVDGDWAKITVKGKDRPRWVHQVDGRWYAAMKGKPEDEGKTKTGE